MPEGAAQPSRRVLALQGHGRRAGGVYDETFREFIPAKYQLEVVVGTHPVPQNYYATHAQLGTWDSTEAQEAILPILVDEETRRAYD
jgi:hypothetical protein